MSTAYPLCRRGVADVHLVPMFSDNYGYIFNEPGSEEAFAVDPGDGAAVLSAAESLGLSLSAVLCTHKHADHVGGNELLKRAIPGLNIIATRYEDIPCATQRVGDGDELRLGRSLSVRVLFTPCHTAGHVLYLIDTVDGESSAGRAPMLFSGDTLFVGGCGRFFEGTAAQMESNMRAIALLPEDTLVFCAHEYTESNYKFLAHVDPSLQKKLEEIKSVRARGEPTVPSTIRDELTHNLFMRCSEEHVQRLVGSSNSVEAMHELRTRKNNFK